MIENNSSPDINSGKVLLLLAEFLMSAAPSALNEDGESSLVDISFLCHTYFASDI